jgi:hypothetical protein
MAAKIIDIGGVKHFQVTFPVESPRLSSTEKSFIVGYTNELTTLEVDGKSVKIMATATVKNASAKRSQSGFDMNMLAEMVAAKMANK